MRFGPRLRRAFFDRPCLEVAPELVGMILHRQLPDGTRLAGRVVEVEAYLGDGSDPGSHAHRGETPRNRSMFGPPGRLYVYRSYGIHHCLNLVCEPAGSAAAILLRALEPLIGVETMRTHRRLPDARGPEWIAVGPGRLCQAFEIDLDHDGASVLSGDISLREPPAGVERARIECGPRVGLGKGVELPYRYFAADDPWVSRWRAGGRRGGNAAAQVRPG